MKKFVPLLGDSGNDDTLNIDPHKISTWKSNEPQMNAATFGAKNSIDYMYFTKTNSPEMKTHKKSIQIMEIDKTLNCR